MPASLTVTLGIPLIAGCVAAAFLWAVRRVCPQQFSKALAGTLLWVVVWAGLALAGVLARFDLRPPPMAGMFVAVLGGGLALGLSPLGRALARGVPLWALIAFHGFRLPLEWVMHRAATEGVMPAVMSYAGYNFDVVTGGTALLLAWAARRSEISRGIALAWNVLGTVLLAAIITIALLSSPMVRAFGPDQVNLWVTRFPFVYLPAVLVFAAVAGHVVIYRRLAFDARAR